MQQDDISFSIHGRVGLVLLDRPRALNALSAEMAAALREVSQACDSADIDIVIDRIRADPGRPPLQAHRATLDHVFAGQDLCRDARSCR